MQKDGVKGSQEWPPMKYFTTSGGGRSVGGCTKNGKRYEQEEEKRRSEAGPSLAVLRFVFQTFAHYSIISARCTGPFQGNYFGWLTGFVKAGEHVRCGWLANHIGLVSLD